MTEKLTQHQQDAEVLRVIKAIGFPISAKALHEIFRGKFHNTEVTQSVWRHMNEEV